MRQVREQNRTDGSGNGTGTTETIWNVINPVHYVPMLLYMVGYMVWFHFLETVPRAHYTVLSLPVDHRIPFVPAFVIPYFSWFFFVPLWAACLYYWDRKMYDRLSTCLMIGMTCFLVISTMWPNAQVLRQDVVLGSGFCSRLVHVLWRSDTPSNVFPSMHAFNTMVIWISVIRSKGKFLSRKGVKAVISVWALLICLSTVLIKQHSLLDVIGAAVLAAVLFIPVFRKNHYFHFRRFLSKKDLEMEKREGKEGTPQTGSC